MKKTLIAVAAIATLAPFTADAAKPFKEPSVTQTPDSLIVKYDGAWELVSPTCSAFGEGRTRIADCVVADGTLYYYIPGEDYAFSIEVGS